jgi:hypothetical protein
VPLTVTDRVGVADRVGLSDGVAVVESVGDRDTVVDKVREPVEEPLGVRVLEPVAVLLGVRVLVAVWEGVGETEVLVVRVMLGVSDDDRVTVGVPEGWQV